MSLARRHDGNDPRLPSLNQEGMKMKISRAEAVKKIETAKGTGYFCSAIVARRRKGRKGEKPGELRTFNFRGGVRKGVKGVGLSYNPKEHNLIVIWDNMADGTPTNFRTIAIEGIKNLQIEHERFEVTA